MIHRMGVLAACLLLGSGLIAKASRTEEVPARESLMQFPYEIDAWRGVDTPPPSADVLDVLGVDDYLSRYYRADLQSVGLYIGYYESQRQGDTIHSPLNCLPGAGWHPVSRSYLPIRLVRVDGQPLEITVNRYVIERGLERQVVLYWYQSHGRIVASEYRSKLYMIFDAMRLNRSDAALVRVTSPQIAGHSGAGEGVEVDFVRKIFPLLDRFLPN